MRKRKALKGGYIGNPASTGPALKESLYKIKNDDLLKVKATYDELYEKSKEDVKLALGYKQAREQEYKNAQDRDLNILSRVEKSSIETKKLLFRTVSGVLGFIIKFIGSIINFIRQFTAYVISKIAHGGQGAILKAIIAIGIIIAIFVGFTYGIDFFSKDKALDNYNDIKQRILNTDYDKYLTMPNSDTYMAKIQDKLNSLIPNSYRYTWFGFFNSISYITTGKNKYDSYLEDREELSTGRCDDIIHINFSETSNNFIKERTYSIIEPKNIILKYDNNLYNDSDYYKIDSNIKVLVKNYHNICEIPIRPNENTGKYELKLNNNNYSNNSNNLIVSNQSNLIKPIFDNELNFASFNNVLYTKYYNSSSVIASYGVKLINPNYKGPILRLTTAREIRNQFNNKEKTANFYNVYNTKDLYCIIDNKKITYNEFFATKSGSTIYVAAIYDQSGNNHNFIFKDNDNKYMPEYEADDKLIRFYNRRILFLSKPIIYKNININAKMSVIKSQINTNDDNKNIAQKELDDFNTRKNTIINMPDDFKKFYYDLFSKNDDIDINDKIKKLKQPIKTIDKTDMIDENYYTNLKKTYDFIIKYTKQLKNRNYDDFGRYLLKNNNVDEHPNSKKSIKIVAEYKDYLEYKNNIKKYNLLTLSDYYEFIKKYLKYNVNGDKTVFDTKKEKLEEKLNIEKDKYVDKYMSFLATNTEAIAKIEFKENKTEDLYFQYKDDSNQKSANYKLSNDKKELINIEFDFKSDDDITIETLGNILDSRSQNDKILDTKGGEILAHLTNIHSFRGYLSELRIFRNS